MLGELITSKTRLRLLIKFFISQANRGYLNGLATEMGESTNAIRKELNHLQGAGYLEKVKVDNKVEYKANVKHPLFDTLQKVVLKQKKTLLKQEEEQIKQFFSKKEEDPLWEIVKVSAEWENVEDELEFYSVS